MAAETLTLACRSLGRNRSCRFFNREFLQEILDALECGSLGVSSPIFWVRTINSGLTE